MLEGGRRPRARAATRGQDAEASVLDVAIVGGGVAGAYCAWRQTQPEAAASGVLAASGAPGAPRVALFEQSDRLGGRLWSFVPPGMPHLRAELGGMRLPTDQPLVMALVARLGIATVPFPTGDAHNLRYLRGKRFTVAELAKPDVVPYHLPPKLRGKTPGQIVVATIERYVPHASQLSEVEWNEVRQKAAFEGVPLSELGFRYLIERDLPDEALRFIRDATGTEIFTRNANAADVMYEVIAAASSPPVVTPLLGMEEIPRSLAADAERNGAAIHRQHRVRRIVSIAGATAHEPGLRLEVETAAGAVSQVAARHVILALPPRAIALLAADSLPRTAPSFPTLQAALVPLAAGKAFLGYERPWWRALGISAGRTVSDLPLNVTYYLGSEGERPGADPADRSSLLMASSAEGPALDYWATFRTQDPGLPGGAPFQRPDLGTVPAELALPERAVSEMQRQLRLVHGPEAPIGDPTMAVIADWRRDPYGAGYHIWAVGASAWEMIPIAREPLPGINLSICGEAWSSHQGWTQGALMTAERTLQERLGLVWPDWLPPGVDLGP
jgi:monoamine oxidase